MKTEDLIEVLERAKRLPGARGWGEEVVKEIVKRLKEHDEMKKEFYFYKEKTYFEVWYKAKKDSITKVCSVPLGDDEKIPFKELVRFLHILGFEITVRKV